MNAIRRLITVCTRSLYRLNLILPATQYAIFFIHFNIIILTVLRSPKYSHFRVYAANTKRSEGRDYRDKLRCLVYIKTLNVKKGGITS